MGALAAVEAAQAVAVTAKQGQDLAGSEPVPQLRTCEVPGQLGRGHGRRHARIRHGESCRRSRGRDVTAPTGGYGGKAASPLQRAVTMAIRGGANPDAWPTSLAESVRQLPLWLDIPLGQARHRWHTYCE